MFSILTTSKKLGRLRRLTIIKRVLVTCIEKEIYFVFSILITSKELLSFGHNSFNSPNKRCGKTYKQQCTLSNIHA